MEPPEDVFAKRSDLQLQIQQCVTEEDCEEYVKLLRLHIIKVMDLRDEYSSSISRGKISVASHLSPQTHL